MEPVEPLQSDFTAVGTNCLSPKVFSPFCHRWSFGSLPLLPLACLVGDTSFPAISSTWLHRYYLNWTEMDDAGWWWMMGLPWGKPYRGRIHIWDYPKGNQAIRTPSPVQGLTGDPGELTPVLGLASDCSAQSDCRGCLEDSTRVHRPGNWTGGEKGGRIPGWGGMAQQRDTGQFFPPITYPIHGKKLAQRGDCRILQRCSVSPSPQLCRCLPKRRRAPTHGRM